ncbi:MAG: knotted carbamoyltransferase YgeW [Deltaproteobacteria bacterium]|nr:knotted carbamoyltransferase YgeW [Deltaproteobacteria bacterium]
MANPAFPELNPTLLAALEGRSLQVTGDFDTDSLGAILDLADAFWALDRAGVRAPLCPNELAYALFFDQSTRTRSAWAGAAARLGMQPVIVDGSSTQVAHGETAEETGAMLGMNAHALGVRHDLILHQGRAFIGDILKGISDYLKATDDKRCVPIVNLQCDYDHPTQTLADLLHLRHRFGGVQGKKIAVSWAYSPSYAKPLSVPQGLITLLPRFGANVVLAHPPGYRLMDEALQKAEAGAKAGGGSFEIVDSMDAAFEGADVVYPKSWGPMELMEERLAAKDRADLAEIEARALDQNARHRDWICNEERLAKAAADPLYMHCLPADIGAEASSGVLEQYRVSLAEEANGKVYVIMALLAAAKVPGLAAKMDALRQEMKA